MYAELNAWRYVRAVCVCYVFGICQEAAMAQLEQWVPAEELAGGIGALLSEKVRGLGGTAYCTVCTPLRYCYCYCYCYCYSSYGSRNTSLLSDISIVFEYDSCTVLLPDLCDTSANSAQSSYGRVEQGLSAEAKVEQIKAYAAQRGIPITAGAGKLDARSVSLLRPANGAVFTPQ